MSYYHTTVPLIISAPEIMAWPRYDPLQLWQECHARHHTPKEKNRRKANRNNRTTTYKCRHLNMKVIACDSIEHGKQLCWEDYEKRVRECLFTVTEKGKRAVSEHSPKPRQN